MFALTYTNTGHPRTHITECHLWSYIIDKNNTIRFSKILLCDASKSEFIANVKHKNETDRSIQTFLGQPKIRESRK